MSQKVLVIGGIGSGTVIAQALIDAQLKGDNRLEFAGLINDKAEKGEFIQGIPVVAKQNKENIKLYTEKGYTFIYSLHRTDGGKKFVDLFSELGLSEENITTFIHPTAYVASDVEILPGSIVMPYVMISSYAKLGLNALIMTGATIGHNTQLGDFNHIASQAVLGAHLRFGTGVHVGLNACVREYLCVGDYSTIGMGAVLTKNIGNNEVWVGNPAKFLRMTK